MNYKISLLLLLGAGLSSLAGPTVAQPNEYDLEMIVFLDTRAHSTEVGRTNSNRAAENDERFRRLFQRTGAPLAEPLQAGHMQEIADKLGSDPDIVVLQHAGWRQPIGLISEVPYVDVSAPGLGEDSGLRGVVRFYHTPLLYADVFLKFTPFADPLELDDTAYSGEAQQAGEPLINAWFLEEKRRVRLKELHYLDHPRLGVIFGAWPIDKTSETPEEPEDS